VFEDGGGWDLLDMRSIVRPRDSIEWTRRLTDVGVFAGISSGAVMCAAARCAREIDEGVIVFVVADGGWKYLSTGAWTDDLDVVEARAKGTIYF
jgi:cysteine synthase B